MSGDYIRGTNHAATLASALNDFHEALTKRWREKVCDAVLAGDGDYPVAIRRSVSAANYQPLWEYWTIPARHHLLGLDGCAFVRWVQGGQDGPLSGVQCDGSTGTREDVEMVDPTTGRIVTIPPHIECGMGSLLSTVEDWAWGEREAIFHKLPLFDHHDLGALERAHDDFLRAGRRLALEASAGSHASAGSFDAAEERGVPALVANVATKDGGSQDWWAGWTGLAAERARSGFFASVAPTLNNQSGILGCLANLYSDRAAIIEKGRNDALYWIQWATDSLGETELVTTDRTNGWKAVQAIGTGVTISGGWSGVGGAVGAGIVLVGFLGENLDPGGTSEEYAHELVPTVERLHSEIDELLTELDRREREYHTAVNNLQATIHSIHSYNLELYDFTRNDPLGDQQDDGQGYFVDVGTVLRLAEDCYELGEEYEPLLGIIGGTADADRHLADRDGNPTEADRALTDVRDQLRDFVKTSCARYLVAGDQVKAAAEAYVEVDTDQRGTYDRTIDSWERQGVGEYDAVFNPERYAQETDRSGGYDPYEGHHARGGAQPGAGDGEDYVVESEGTGS